MGFHSVFHFSRFPFRLFYPCNPCNPWFSAFWSPIRLRPHGPTEQRIMELATQRPAVAG